MTKNPEDLFGPSWLDAVQAEREVVARRTRIGLATEILDELDDDGRVEVFAKFCTYCGTADLPCYCMGDD